MVQVYKYLGCVVDEHLQGTRRVEERGKAGARALNDWFRRCRGSERSYLCEADRWNLLLNLCYCMGQRYGVVSTTQAS